MEASQAGDTEKFIAVNGINVCYTDAGNQRPPVIFIHDVPLDKSTWDLQAEALKDNWRVITYDVRGFGRSGTDDKKADVELLAQDLLGLMDALEIPCAAVCGHSMGGYILLEALKRSPGKFRAIVLAGTQCIAESEEFRESYRNMADEIGKEGMGTFAEKLAENLFCKSSAGNTRWIERTKQSIKGARIGSVVSALHALAHREETCSYLDKIAVPALILCGKEDTVNPPARSEYLHSHIKGARLFVIEKAGHMPHIEQPERFNRHLKDLLSSL